MSKLWLVEINYDDFKYDEFVSGVVWADSAEEAERILRAEVSGLPQGEKTRLIVKPAPTSGIVHEHWQPG